MLMNLQVLFMFFFVRK